MAHEERRLAGAQLIPGGPPSGHESRHQPNTHTGQRRGTHKHVPAPALPGADAPSVVREIKQVPMGQYSPLAAYGIDPGWQHAHDFAVLLTGNGSCIVLVAAEMFNSHPQFELARRIKEKDLKAVFFQRASREILRSVHDAHAAMKIGEDTDTEKLAWDLVDSAVDMRASDIHLETRGSFAQFYLRIHGERVAFPEKSAKTVNDICGVLYNCHADAMNKGGEWNPNVPQDTTIERTTASGKNVQLRFHTSPIHPSGNLQAVIRLLVMDDDTIRPIADMGYTPAQVDVIESMLLGSQGMFLCAGPVNSGKSTTLQTALDRIYQMRGSNIKVVTAEDPVEYLVRAACQMGVPAGRKDLKDEATGSIYTTLLKAMLRQDPDVAMIGEIRDHDSADIAKQLGLAGRKLLSTLHVYEAFAVFPRLRELGVPESVLFMPGFVSGVVCQRLLPTLCSECSMPLDLALERKMVAPDRYGRVLKVAGDAHERVRVRGAGCPHCNGLGITGRTLCAELLVPDSKLLALLSRGELLAAREYWAEHSRHLDVDGMGSTMLAHAIAKMREGLLDPVHVEMHIGRIELTGAAARAVLH